MQRAIIIRGPLNADLKLLSANSAIWAHEVPLDRPDDRGHQTGRARQWSEDDKQQRTGAHSTITPRARVRQHK